MEIRVCPVDLDRLVPSDRLQTLFRFPMEFDEGRFALGIDQAEGMDAKTFHGAQRTRDRPIRHRPHHHMHGFGRQADEIPEIVMRGLCLREIPIRLRLGGMDQVREFYRILDEEDRDIIADQIPIAFLRIELDRKAAHIAGKVGRPLRSGNGRKAHEGGHLFADALEDIGAGDIAQRVRQFEIAMRAIATGMNHALRDALMVKMEHFFAEMRVFQQGRPPRALLQRILVVGNRNALRRRHRGHIATGHLMGLATFCLGFGIDVRHAVGGRRRRHPLRGLRGDRVGRGSGFVGLGHERSLLDATRRMENAVSGLPRSRSRGDLWNCHVARTRGHLASCAAPTNTNLCHDDFRPAAGYSGAPVRSCGQSDQGEGCCLR